MGEYDYLYLFIVVLLLLLPGLLQGIFNFLSGTHLHFLPAYKASTQISDYLQSTLMLRCVTVESET